MFCLELQDVGKYKTDGESLWMDVKFTPTIPLCLQPRLPFQTPSLALYSDGIIYKHFGNGYRYSLSECDSLSKQGVKVSLDYFCKAASNIGSLIKYNWQDHQSRKSAVIGNLQYLLPELVLIIVDYFAQLDVVQV